MSQYHSVINLHQVLIVDGLGLPSTLPSGMVRNTEIAKNLYPDATYRLWSGEDLRDFIRSEIGSDVLKAFDVLAPYSYKCDLARYSLMYVYGGLYFDLAIRMLNTWNVPTKFGVAAFKEMYQGMDSWTATQTSILWSLPGRPEWRFAIEAIVANCENRFYGSHDHYPTAGALLGRSFAAAMALHGQRHEADDQFLGEVRYITPERQPQNVTYVSPAKTMVAIRTKLKAGDLSEMGLSGTNNYTSMWRAKKVYGERDHVWNADDVYITVEEPAAKTLTGIAVIAGTCGRVMYGPFVNLDRGSYRLSFYFSPGTRFSRLFVDVCAEYSAEIIKEFEILESEDREQDVAIFDFILDHNKQNVEFRLNVFGDFSGEINRIELKEMDDQVYGFADPKIELIGVRRVASGIRIPEGTSGRIMYGPYIALEAGSYRMTVKFGSITYLGYIEVEICANSGNHIINRHIHIGDQTQNKEIIFEFDVDGSYSDVEFRVSVGKDFFGEFRSFSLKPFEKNTSPSKMLEERGGKKPRRNEFGGINQVLSKARGLFKV